MLKKIFTFIFLFIISLTIVNAKENNDLKIVDVKITEKVGAVEVIDPVFSYDEIDSSITFKDLNDI